MEIEQPKLPEPSIEEQTLKNIREQVDYMEEQYYDNGLIEYTIESSAIINKTIKQTWLYDEFQRGKGSKIEIL